MQRGTDSLADAVSAYDEEVVERGAKEVRLSDENGHMVHDFDRVLNSPIAKKGLNKNADH